MVNLAPYSFFNAVSEDPHFVMFASGGTQGQPAQCRGDGRVRVLARHLRFARSDEQDIGRGGARGRRDAACGSHARALTSGGAATRRGVAGRVRMPLLADHRAAGTERQGEQECNRAGQVVGVHIADEAIVKGKVDVTMLKPIARLGYGDYAVIDQVFTLPRPDVPRPRRAQ